MATYEDFRNRYEMFLGSSTYKRVMDLSAELIFDSKAKIIDFHGKPLKLWGDEKKARKFLEEVKLEFREPGCDDGDPPVQEQAPVEPEDNVEPEEQQVVEESKTSNDPSELFKVLKSVKFMSDEEFSTKYATYGEELSPSGTDTS